MIFWSHRYCNSSRVPDCVMIHGNIDNGFSKCSYLRIEKAESSKHCTGMEIVIGIVIVMGMKSIYLVVYVNYYISCLCVISATASFITRVRVFRKKDITRPLSRNRNFLTIKTTAEIKLKSVTQIFRISQYVHFFLIQRN